MAQAKKSPASVHDAIALLIADHQKVTDLFEQFEQAPGMDKIKSLAAQICDELTI